MTVTQLKTAIHNGGFDKDFKLLYSDAATARARYCDAADAFANLFGADRSVSLFSAPGRTEVGGNHTDHQHGCVLAGSVNLDVIAVVAKNTDHTVRIKSQGYPMDEIKLDLLEPQEAENGRAAALIRGMCGIYKQNGLAVDGFDAYTTSNVLKGSGLSSSAAFEVLVGLILSHLFNNGGVDPVNIAKYGQMAENRYFGKPCGLMDQMASAVGGFTGIDFNDPKQPIIEKISFDLSAHKHSLCIVNTGGNHADLTGDYAAITTECRQIANAFGKDFLRDVDSRKFYSQIGALRKTCSDRAILRAMHFFADNDRAVEERKALQRDDFEAFLQLINDSGNSSYKYLQNVFSVSAPLEQGMSLALALTEGFLSGRGACRVHGGGFAGTIQVFVPNDMLDAYKTYIENALGAGSCYVLHIRPVGGYALSEK